MDINTLIEMADEMQDDSLISEIEDEITVFEEKMDSIRTETYTGRSNQLRSKKTKRKIKI